MSDHHDILSTEPTRIEMMFAVPHWEVREVPLNPSWRRNESLAEGWEPFAIAHESMWVRRLSHAAPAPLPPQ